MKSLSLLIAIAIVAVMSLFVNKAEDTVSPSIQIQSMSKTTNNMANRPEILQGAQNNNEEAIGLDQSSTKSNEIQVQKRNSSTTVNTKIEIDEEAASPEEILSTLDDDEKMLLRARARRFFEGIELSEDDMYRAESVLLQKDTQSLQLWFKIAEKNYGKPHEALVGLWKSQLEKLNQKINHQIKDVLDSNGKYQQYLKNQKKYQGQPLGVRN